jgi:hypothetical protein
MKHQFLSLIISIYMFSCRPSDAWWYGDVELGDEYYYMVEPAFNSIQTIETDDSNRSNGYVIRNIELIGYNKNFILAVNNDSLTLKYWVIDKNRTSNYFRKAIQNGQVNEEVIGPIDSTDFMHFATTNKIKMLSKTYYRKKLNYE